jgi:hypothetical protein
MALATTTLSAAVAATDRDIKVASATSVATGRLVRVDQEMMRVAANYTSGDTIVPVLRGINGTKTAAHNSSANVTHGAASDFAEPFAGGPTSVLQTQRAREIVSISATATVTAPTPGSDKVIILNGTSVIAVTLTAPTKDQDGDILIICGNGKAAHTITHTGGYGDGGSSYDVLTFSASARNTAMFIAANGVWNLLPSLIGGTATAVTATIA